MAVVRYVSKSATMPEVFFVMGYDRFLGCIISETDIENKL